MATAKPSTAFRPRRRMRNALLLVALLCLAALTWFWHPIMANATADAAYGARMGCSCRFAANRSLSSCRDDFEPGMALVSLGEDIEAKSVTARVPLLSSQTATFRQGEGCVLEKWED